MLVEDGGGRVELSRRGPVFVLGVRRGENRFDRSLLTALDRALGIVEEAGDGSALVFAGGDRFFSNGYDLDALAALDRDGRRAFIRDHQRWLARLLRFPRPTAAAIGGHAVGAGALWALACDVRVMRNASAVFWLPEIDARIPFRPGMWALLRHCLSPPTLRDATIAGRKFGGDDALRAGIVHEVVEDARVVPRAIEWGMKRAAVASESLAAMRAAIDGDVADALDAAR